jgi:hypothetical protein
MRAAASQNGERDPAPRPGDARVPHGERDPAPRPGDARVPHGERDPAPRPGGARVPSAERDRLAREALAPLAPGEWPRALLAAIAVCVVVAVGVVVGATTVHDLRHHGGSLPGGLAIALVLAMLAQGMYRHRYWAVLGFEALLAFQIVVTSLALVVASTVTAAVVCVVGIGLGGWLFWKLVRVMGRIQAGERPQGD